MDQESWIRTSFGFAVMIGGTGFRYGNWRLTLWLEIRVDLLKSGSLKIVDDFK